MDIAIIMKSIFILISFLQTFTNIHGQSFLNRRRIPRFPRRTFYNRHRASPEIPHFLSKDLAWMYSDNERFQAKPRNTVRTVQRIEEPQMQKTLSSILKSVEMTEQLQTTVKPKQYSQKGKVFGHCDVGNDDDLDDIFPGIFQTESEILSEPKQVIKTDEWHANKKRTYGPPKSKLPVEVEISTPRMARTNNNSEVIDIRPQDHGSFPVCQCCQTISAHEVYENITIRNGETYKVVELPGKFQAVPVGRCPEQNLCLYGDCVQHYSRHHLLIWNSTVPYWPPFDFAFLEYPTHCTWENVGK